MFVKHDDASEMGTSEKEHMRNVKTATKGAREEFKLFYDPSCMASDPRNFQIFKVFCKTKKNHHSVVFLNIWVVARYDKF